MAIDELPSVPVRRRAAPYVCRLTLHGLTAEVEAPRALKRTLSLVLGSYPPAPDDGEFDFRVAVVPSENDANVLSVVTDGHSYPESNAHGRASVRVEWMVISEFVKRWTQFVHVHAGLIGNAQQSALLIGRSGSGKSTTSVALAMDGFDLYSDDVALIDRATLRPWVVPRPIKLDNHSRRMLRKRGLIIPRNRRLQESVERAILPGLPPVGAGGPPLTTAIFYAPGQQKSPTLRRLTSAEAIMRLVMQSSSERLDESGPTEGALALVNSVACYELVKGDLGATAQLIKVHLETSTH